MSPLPGVRATSSTIGQANPGHVGSHKPYRYRGIPDWIPGDPRYRNVDAPVNAGSAERSARREDRIREFAAILTGLGADDPADAPADLLLQAADRFGVGKKTAVGYRTELRRQRQEGATP